MREKSEEQHERSQSKKKEQQGKPEEVTVNRESNRVQEVMQYIRKFTWRGEQRGIASSSEGWSRQI